MSKTEEKNLEAIVAASKETFKDYMKKLEVDAHLVILKKFPEFLKNLKGAKFTNFPSSIPAQTDEIFKMCREFNKDTHSKITQHLKSMNKGKRDSKIIDFNLLEFPSNPAANEINEFCFTGYITLHSMILEIYQWLYCKKMYETERSTLQVEAIESLTEIVTDGLNMSSTMITHHREYRSNRGEAVRQYFSHIGSQDLLSSITVKDFNEILEHGQLIRYAENLQGKILSIFMGKHLTDEISSGRTSCT